MMKLYKIIRSKSHLASRITSQIQLVCQRKYCDAGEKCPSLRPPEKKGLIVGVYEGCNNEPVLTPAASKFNDKINGKLAELIAVAGNLTKRGAVRSFNALVPEYWAVAVVGLGSKKLGLNEVEELDEAREAVRRGAALGSRELSVQGVDHILVEGFGYPEQAAEGSALAVWKYQENKQRKHWRVIPTLELFDDPDHDAWQRGLFKAEAQNLARRLTDTPANQMTPTAFAQQAVNVLCPCGIKVEVHDKDWIEAKKLTAFLTVAKGSCEPPAFIEMTYCGGPVDQKPICLVGKGVTYSAGGLCLKRNEAESMRSFRGDMAGAAVVVAVIRAAAALSLPLNLIGIAPMCENMPSGMAIRPGDVIPALSGLNIMVENTDHEGHLVLADALVYAQMFHKPRMLIDLGTMTHGMRRCFGTAPTGVFSNNENLWLQMRKAGIIAGDRVWRLPLWDYYLEKMTRYDMVDTNCQGKGFGSTCLAAGFLKQFVQCVDWLHMDITGSGKFAENNVLPMYSYKRATGRPTRTVIQFLYQMACPQERDRELK